MMNTARVYQDEHVTGIHNEDEGVELVRILLIGGLLSGEYDFLDTVSHLPNAYPVFQNCGFQLGLWNCGIRWYLEANLAIQVVSLNNGLFWDYWSETILPHLDSIAGTLCFMDAARPRWFYKEALSRMATLEVYHEWSGAPYVYALTGSGSPVALSPDEIHRHLNIPAEIPVVPCVTTDAESVKNVLLALLMHVRDSLENAADEADI